VRPSLIPTYLLAKHVNLEDLVEVGWNSDGWIARLIGSGALFLEAGAQIHNVPDAALSLAPVRHPEALGGVDADEAAVGVGHQHHLLAGGHEALGGRLDHGHVVV
jgi:hypothetical protein